MIQCARNFLLVIPAQAGIQCLCCCLSKDTGFRVRSCGAPRNDELEKFRHD